MIVPSLVILIFFLYLEYPSRRTLAMSFLSEKFMQTGKIFSRDPYRIMELNVGAWEVQQLPSIKPLFLFFWLFAFCTSKLIVKGEG
jgi:hypothetical protein